MIHPFKMLKDLVAWRKIIASSDNYIAYLRRQGVRIGEYVSIYARDRIVFDLTRPWLVEIGNNVVITLAQPS